MACLGLAVPAGAWSREPTTMRSNPRLEVLGVWEGVEQARFADVLAAFARRSGVRVTYSSAGRSIAQALDERFASGRVPDVAMLPQPGLIDRLVAAKRLAPLDDGIRRVVGRNYAAVWRRLGSVAGRLYGVWFKAANKSLVWYDVASFERLGVVPPDDIESFFVLAHELSARGVRAFSVGAADGWTLTDWFENLYVVLAGPQRYEQLARHRIPWTDPSVVSALNRLGELLSPDLMAGGVEGALQNDFESSVRAIASRPPAAAMVFEGDFVAGALAPSGARIGIDVDVFPFPGEDGIPRSVIGGGDAAVLLRRSAAGSALLRFLATPRAARIWAAAGGFVSPNVNVDLAVYPNRTARTVARRIIEAGNSFRFDLSDLVPASFGAIEGQGIRRALQDFLVHRDPNVTAIELERAATAAAG